MTGSDTEVSLRRAAGMFEREGHHIAAGIIARAADHIATQAAEIEQLKAERSVHEAVIGARNKTVDDLEEKLYAAKAEIERLTKERDEAGDRKDDETYAIGKRDGYGEAVQEIDALTGGDGEYCFCTDQYSENHCPDPKSMVNRIFERFQSLNGLYARIKFLEKHNAGILADLSRNTTHAKIIEAERDALQAENQKLREALDGLADACEAINEAQGRMVVDRHSLGRARAALQSGGER